MVQYYYLKPDEIIKEGDEYCFDNSTLVWRRCRDSIGRTCAQHSRYLGGLNWVVRREIKTTKLGECIMKIKIQICDGEDGCGSIIADRYSCRQRCDWTKHTHQLKYKDQIENAPLMRKAVVQEIK